NIAGSASGCRSLNPRRLRHAGGCGVGLTRGALQGEVQSQRPRAERCSASRITALRRAGGAVPPAPVVVSRFVTVRRAERIERFCRDGRIASRQPMFNNDAVGTTGGFAVSTACPHQPLIAMRASRDMKHRFAALAASRGMTESHLFMLLVDTVLQHNPDQPDEGSRVDGASKNRVTLRLRAGDIRKV